MITLPYNLKMTFWSYNFILSLLDFKCVFNLVSSFPVQLNPAVPEMSEPGS